MSSLYRDAPGQRGYLRVTLEEMFWIWRRFRGSVRVARRHLKGNLQGIDLLTVSGGSGSASALDGCPSKMREDSFDPELPLFLSREGDTKCSFPGDGRQEIVRGMLRALRGPELGFGVLQPF